MLRCALALCVLALAPSALRAEQPAPPRQEAPRPLVAVLEFKSPLPEAKREPFGERLRYASQVRSQLASHAPFVRVMTLDEMQRLAASNPAGLDQCDDESCISVARLLGADAAIDGVFGLDEKGGGPAHKKLKATLRLWDVRKGGEPVAKLEVRARSDDWLIAEVALGTRKLIGKLPGAPGRKSAQRAREAQR
jgi:hypothetical protein